VPKILIFSCPGQKLNECFKARPCALLLGFGANAVRQDGSGLGTCFFLWREACREIGNCVLVLLISRLPHVTLPIASPGSFRNWDMLNVR
jgi:hypothetical protein